MEPKAEEGGASEAFAGTLEDADAPSCPKPEPRPLTRTPFLLGAFQHHFLREKDRQGAGGQESEKVQSCPRVFSWGVCRVLREAGGQYSQPDGCLPGLAKCTATSVTHQVCSGYPEAGLDEAPQVLLQAGVRGPHAEAPAEEANRTKPEEAYRTVADTCLLCRRADR